MMYLIETRLIRECSGVVIDFLAPLNTLGVHFLHDEGLHAVFSGFGGSGTITKTDISGCQGELLWKLVTACPLSIWRGKFGTPGNVTILDRFIREVGIGAIRSVIRIVGLFAYRYVILVDCDFGVGFIQAILFFHSFGISVTEGEIRLLAHLYSEAFRLACRNAVRNTVVETFVFF